jgi:molybdopterin molybdotransferase
VGRSETPNGKLPSAAQLSFDIYSLPSDTAGMLPLEEARKRLLSAVPLLPAESVALDSASGRFLARAVHASINLPPFDNSAMDGYALRSADVRRAKPSEPAILTLAGRIEAGAVSAHTLRDGECMRIFTGSALPPGADAVVMQEACRSDSARPDRIQILETVQPWENVRFRGEDVKEGALLLRAGERLSGCAAALLAATGLQTVEVRRRPVVGILGTGSELLEPGQPLSPGKIYESNRATLAALTRSAAGVPRVYPIVEDTLAATRDALERAGNECDLLLTSGGVSVGELDFVKTAFEALGGRVDFWKVAVKPGKPFVFGRKDTKLWLGLPGNPVSCLVTFVLLAQPALFRMQGAEEVEPRTVPGELSEPITNRGERRHFVRARLDSAGRVHSTGVQASHVLSSLAKANGLVDVPPDTTWPAGTKVQVIPLDF